MDSFIRIASISNELELGNPGRTAEQILSLIEGVKPYAPDVYLFPAHALTGNSLGTLGYHKSLISACEEAVRKILHQTKKLDAYLVIGSLLFQNGKPENAIYVLHKGEIKAILTTQDFDFVFAVRDLKFNILAQPLAQLPQWISNLSELGVDVTLIPADYKALAGNNVKLEESLRCFSSAVSGGIAYCGGCNGDTSFPYLYRGAAGCFECGTTLAFKTALQGSCFTVTDFDCDIIRSQKAANALPIYCQDFCDLIQPAPHQEILRVIDQDPYLPKEETERKNYLLDLFQLQSASLASRLRHIHCDKVVVGVSGGLDSTLTLLVCSNAFTAMNLPQSNITAITMQGFGTTDNTYQNALTLMRQLGCTIREIPIRESVLQHFQDIGQNPETRDVTYENAQARERAQILLDVANQVGGLVVGTGDLSEEALGFATFAGDHIANFNVNTCVTKTMIRQLVSLLSQTNRFKNCSDVLQEILSTPISPELLPPDEGGAIQQKTEEILGPYLLHDFFLYYFVKYHFSASKLYHYAKKAFQGSFSDEYIKEKLIIFVKRFCSSQFKRSCAPDSSVLTEVNVSNAEFQMPSDIGADVFLHELEQFH